MSPDDVKERYAKVKTFTEECLNEVAEILDKSGTWRDLAESLGYDHLVRTNICVSSTNLLQFAMVSFLFISKAVSTDLNSLTEKGTEYLQNKELP